MRNTNLAIPSGPHARTRKINVLSSVPTPLDSEFLPFHAPEIGDEEIQSVVETLRSGWLTTGENSNCFETDLAQYIGCQQAVAANSGAAALHLALDAVGIQAGDEVVPTKTFSASAEAVLSFKAKPVLVDYGPDKVFVARDNRR